MVVQQKLAATNNSAATVEEVLHVLAASVAYDDEAAIPWAVLVRVAGACDVDLTEPDPDPYCVACHTSNCGNNCDRDYERWAER